MTTLLKQFRLQYPEGALTASLVSVNDGQYIVRAAILQKGEEIATGLAASVDVQIAEDKARNRALAVLGIVVEMTQSQNGQIQAEQVQREQVESGSVEASGAVAELTLVPALTADVVPISQAVATTQTDLLSEPDLTEIGEPPEPADIPEDEADLGAPIDAIAEETLPPTEPKTSAATIALENFNTSATPVDLSDVIAQTDVELSRLGWTSVQGREYLEQNYGKRSRQQLTDEELMSFLLYLEEQP
ncbi:MAG: hypothetical protein AAFO84_06450 [Cyanobacteria bacterium J06598_1]